jgi:hypothetical protein
MTTICAHPSDNHSDDTLTVYHGADPLELCGYHAQRGVQAALDAIEEEEAHARCEAPKSIQTSHSRITGAFIAYCKNCYFKCAYWECGCELEHNCKEYKN